MSDQESDAATELSPQEVEKVEEAKLKAKYPGGPGGPSARYGPSAFLQKRFNKGQRFFDSGDYQMAQQKKASNKQTVKVPMNSFATGEAIPTPETVPARKTSIIQTSKFTPNVS